MNSLIEFRKNLQNVLDEEKNRDATKGRLNETFRFEIPECDEENHAWVDFKFKPDEIHLNPYDGIHGGIISALIDTCGGYTAFALKGKFPTTTDISVSYIRPMQKDSEFRIHMEVTLNGRRMVGFSGKIYDMKTGILCAAGMVKYMLLDKTFAKLGDGGI